MKLKIILDKHGFLVYCVPMYIDTVPNRNSKPTILLREGWREGKKTPKRTLANLTKWPEEKVEALRRLLKDEPLGSPNDIFEVQRNLPHGHVYAVLGTMRKIGLDKIISTKKCPEQRLVMAMIAERLIHPCSKLSTTRVWHSSTLAGELGVDQADENDLYQAMDWLLSRQARIEKKLAERHLAEDDLVFYDVTSSYYEGRTCTLAKYGHSRDGKKGSPIVVYGAMTDRKGRPVALEVYSGNTGDPTTVPDQVEKLRKRFGLERVVLVGDRGMLTQVQINMLKKHPGLGWISALRSGSVKKLVADEVLQPSLFDQTGLAEITWPALPGERLIVCYNPFLADDRRRTREELLLTTQKAFEKIAGEISRRRKKLLKDAEIGKKIGKVLNRYKMGKHFKVTIEDNFFTFHRKEESIRREADLDGFYVIRTSETAERLSAEETVRGYKTLSKVEQVFRSMKSLDLHVRPIWHREEGRVRAHIFLCMLAYYLEWHMRKALTPLLFDDEELDIECQQRHPVAPAQPSDSAMKKKKTKKTPDGFPVHSFDSLLLELATQCKNQCRIKSDPSSPTFDQVTLPTPLQTKAFQLLGLFPGNGI